MIWVECVSMYDEEDGPWEKSEVRSFLGPDNPFPQRSPVQRKTVRERDLPNTLKIIYRDTFLFDGSKTNESVVAATQEAVSHTWMGPVIAMKLNGLGADPRSHMDIDLNDYRDVVDYFTSYRNAGSRTSGPIVKGVKISCRGEQTTFGTAKYVAVDVPKDHPVFNSPIAPMSELVGLPVRARKYPADRRWRDNTVSDVFENQAVTFLHQTTDVTSSAWGWAPFQWQNEIGSVLVVRSDKKDITTHLVEALCHFCQNKMQPLFENGLGGGLVDMTREEVTGHITPEKFRQYFEVVRGTRIGDDPSWAAATPAEL